MHLSNHNSVCKRYSKNFNNSEEIQPLGGRNWREGRGEERYRQDRDWKGFIRIHIRILNCIIAQSDAKHLSNISYLFMSNVSVCLRFLQCLWVSYELVNSSYKSSPNRSSTKKVKVFWKASKIINFFFIFLIIFLLQHHKS